MPSSAKINLMRISPLRSPTLWGVANGGFRTMLVEKLRIDPVLFMSAALIACGLGYIRSGPAAVVTGSVYANGTRVSAVFTGSSPCDEPIRRILQIPAAVDAHMIQWNLTLHHDSNTRAPGGYELLCKYGVTVPNQPGLNRGAPTVKRKGQWSIAKGTKFNSEAVVYELDGALSLLKVDSKVLHVLDRDRHLLTGGPGWSYTLCRADAAEKTVDPSLYAYKASESYAMLPVAVGP